MLFTSTGCAVGVGLPEDESFAGAPAAIINGQPYEGDPAVFYITDGRGACTAALIAPRAVLTARHCIENDGVFTQPSQMRVLSGPRGQTGTPYANVIQIVTTEDMGPLSGAGQDPSNDIAVLILDRAGSLTPYPIVRERMNLSGQRIVGIGYGLNDGRQGGGSKFRGASTVTQDQQTLFRTSVLVCNGDSGGPGFLSDGRIVGVTHAADLDCTQASIYVRVDAFIDFIDSAVAMAGGYDTPGDNPSAPTTPSTPTMQKPAGDPSGIQPTFGSERLGPGFSPAIYRVQGQAGGDRRAADMDNSCTGLVARPPDHVVTLTADFPRVRFLVDGGNADTTLMIQTPDGGIVCADESDGQHPIIEGNAVSGDYRIWVGDFDGNGAPTYTLGVTEQPNVWIRDMR